MKTSITQLSTKLRPLESLIHEPSTFELAQQLVPNSNSLNVRFKEQHFSLIDEGNETTLAKEAHDEELSSLLLCAQQLITRYFSASDNGSHKVILVDLKARVDKMETGFATLLRRPTSTTIRKSKSRISRANLEPSDRMLRQENHWKQSQDSTR